MVRSTIGIAFGLALQRALQHAGCRNLNVRLVFDFGLDYRQLALGFRFGLLAFEIAPKRHRLS